MFSPVDLLPTPSTYAKVMLQRWRQQAGSLLLETGLNADNLVHQANITVLQQLQVFANAMRFAKRSDWALEFGKHLDINSHGPLGFAALSAPTLGDGIAVLEQFASIRSPYLNYRSIVSKDGVGIQIGTDKRPLGALELPVVEIVMHIFQSFVEAILGHRVSEAVLSIAAPPPAHAALYADYFHAPCQFNAPANTFILPADLCALPSPFYDEKSYRVALTGCREALDALLRPDDMSTRLKHLLASHFDQIGAGAAKLSLPRQDQMAKTLCVSPRTLIRQLAAQGTSFRALVAEQQADSACKLLLQARYSIAEVGVLLGYGDAANFSRAFVRTMGMSPGQYRRRQH
jgi:AraC-like DNA-binding protein